MDDLTTIRPNSVYRLADVSDALDISTRSLDRIIAAGKLNAVRVGRYRVVTGRSLLQWLEGSQRGQNKSNHEQDEALRT